MSWKNTLSPPFADQLAAEAIGEPRRSQRIAGAVPIELDAEHAGETAREVRGPLGRSHGGDDHDTGALRPLHACAERRFVGFLQRAQAQVHEGHALLDRPVEGRGQGRRFRAQRAVEDLERVDLGRGRLLADDGGHRGAVADAVHEIMVGSALRVETSAAGE